MKKGSVSKIAILQGVGTLVHEAGKKAASSQFVHDKVVAFGSSREIAEDTYRVSSDLLFQSYLFVGTKKALLVDTGLGIGNLSDKVKEITDKPVEVYCTHSHFGATGGAGQFDNVRIGKADIKSARIYSFITRHIVDAFGKGGADTGKAPTFIAVTDRELNGGIDIGGRTIKLFAVPSHTYGSICFLDEKNKVAAVGDVISPLGIQLLPFAAPLSSYAAALDGFLKEIGEAKIYCSYFPRALSGDYAKKFLNMIREASESNGHSGFLTFRGSLKDRMMMLTFSSKT